MFLIVPNLGIEIMQNKNLTSRMTYGLRGNKEGV